jgi:branched-chain amino acid transport system permease protein
MTLDNLVAIIVSGLVTGSLYALMASGLSLVWGTLRVFNFAHGALLMLGAYVTWTVTVREGLGAGLAVGALVGVLVPRRRACPDGRRSCA